jgi:Ca2+-binding RTX toxin-like protein
VHDITDFDANAAGDTIVAVGGAARAGDGTLQPALFRKDMTTEVLSLPPTATQGFVVAVDPRNPNRIYVNAQGINGRSFVAYSDDNGKTWRDINSLIPPTNGVLPVIEIVAGSPTGTALVGRSAAQDVAMVTHAETRSDPTDAGKTTLFVTGTGGNDVITVTPISADDTDGPTTFQVVLNNVPQGTFTAGRAIVYGLGGDDTLTVGNTQKPVILFGGDGNDRLEVGNGPNILAGGTGNDMLVGGLQQDVLIGAGSDNLIGGDGDDILLGGSSAFDSGTPADVVALEAILQTWISPNNIQERNAATNILLRPGAVHGGTPNILTGGSGRDLFFFGRGDQMLDFDRADDTVTTLL